MAKKERKALVDMVSILGAPQPWPESHSHCIGCEYERIEAIHTGLIALGYLDPPKYKLDKITKNEAGGECEHYVFDGPQPDPLEAWEKFMREEFKIELAPDWRDK